LNHRKPVLTENLAYISVKYNVYLAELFEAIVSAKETGEATCAKLKIEFRGAIKDEAIFLITREDTVVMQFRASEEFLRRKNIHFESWLNTDRIRRQIARQNRRSGCATLIQDLRHGMKNVNLEARVLETSKPSLVQTRYGNSATVSSTWIADKTGKVKLCLWNEQTKLVSVGNVIQIKNASVSTFKGERQVFIGKTGTVSVLQRPTASVNQHSEDSSETVKKAICV
jgi:replication factor A1